MPRLLLLSEASPRDLRVVSVLGALQAKASQSACALLLCWSVQRWPSFGICAATDAGAE